MHAGMERFHIPFRLECRICTYCEHFQNAADQRKGFSLDEQMHREQHNIWISDDDGNFEF